MSAFFVCGYLEKNNHCHTERSRSRHSSKNKNNSAIVILRLCYPLTSLWVTKSTFHPSTTLSITNSKYNQCN
jgi:hypothetical protein